MNMPPKKHVTFGGLSIEQFSYQKISDKQQYIRFLIPKDIYFMFPFL